MSLRSRIIGVLTVFLLSALLFSCELSHDNEKIKIAITKELSAKYLTNYSGWLKRHNPEIEYFNLYPMGIDSALKVLKDCDGLLCTGGEDVFPGSYGKIEDTARCGRFDIYRDSLEFAAINLAIDSKMPVIGVCRGQQILNISQGGSLYIDIPSDFDTTVVHRQKDWRNCYHDVNVIKGSVLYEISMTESHNVTSNHHQGIEVLASGLLISARSSDNLPEAIEWKNRGEKGFLMAVQWHPERMDTLHPLSAPIAKEFLREADIYSNK